MTQLLTKTGQLSVLDLCTSGVVGARKKDLEPF